MILQNDFLKVEINKLGAELKSITDKKNKEWMWNANPEFWGKTSPILFPIVGSLKNNTFYYKNKSYQLSRHGFARDMNFEATQVSPIKIIFTLESSNQTLINFPFNFCLKVIYKLNKNQLFCTYQVQNTNNEIMYFSIGGHPAFALGNNKTDFETYYLEFEDDSTLNRLKLNNGLITEKSEKIILENNKLPLHHNLFINDALVFRDLKSKTITIKNNCDDSKLKITFNDFTHFGIWTVKDAPFICLEPWFGMADLENHNQEIENKEGIITLDSNEIFEKNWSITIN